MSAFLAGRARRALLDDRRAAADLEPASAGAVVAESAAPAPAPGQTADGRPDHRAYLTALAAVAPAEVIALHTSYVSYLRGKFEDHQKQREKDIASLMAAARSGQTTTSLQVKEPAGPLEARKLFDQADASALQLLFWGGLVTTILLYLWGRGSVKLHEVGMSLIPAAAYVVWMMLQPASAFDSVCPSEGQFAWLCVGAERGILAVLLAIGLLKLAATLQKR